MLKLHVQATYASLSANAKTRTIKLVSGVLMSAEHIRNNPIPVAGWKMKFQEIINILNDISLKICFSTIL